MKVLILSCSTGGGHNSCARYIKQEFDDNKIECAFFDYYDALGGKGKELSEKIYLDTLKFNGKIFRGIYKAGEIYSNTKITSPVYLVNKLNKKELYDFVTKNNYDLVITTHLFPAMTLTAINKKVKKINFIFVTTDYQCIPFTQEIRPDFIVLQKGLEDSFIKKGFDSSILKPFGIPVSSKFVMTAKNIREKLGINTETMILIMLGSMGFGNVSQVIDEILKLDDVMVVVICGSNQVLYDTLNKRNNSKLKVVGFTNNMNDYIYSSDIVLSKPGGLSSTEVALMGKPLLHVFPIPGVETYNINYFTNNGMSIRCDNVSDIVTNIKSLMKYPNKRKDIVNSQMVNMNRLSAHDLVSFVKSHYKDIG